MTKFTIQIYHGLRWKFVSKQGDLLDRPEILTGFEAVVVKVMLKRNNSSSSFRILKKYSENCWAPYIFPVKKKEEICWQKYGF